VTLSGYVRSRNLPADEQLNLPGFLAFGAAPSLLVTPADQLANGLHRHRVREVDQCTVWILSAATRDIQYSGPSRRGWFFFVRSPLDASQQPRVAG
jgi:hypothetical protein